MNAGDDGSRSIFRLASRMWTSPITRALVRASSTSSWPAAAMFAGSGTRTPAVTRSGYFFTAASIHSASSGWTPPTPSSTTLRTLWRFMAATYASMAVASGRCECASMSGPV